MIEQLIRERRTVRDFLPTELTPETVLELLDVAVWAPTHGNREPWRFLMFEGEGRRKLIDALVGTFSEEDQAKYRQGYENYLMGTPINLVVTIPRSDNPVIWEEDLCAAACMVQNLQLVAWEREIGMVWKSGEVFNEDSFKAALSIGHEEHVMGLLILGRFHKKPKAQSRTKAELKTVIISS
ncbi:nitroreductase [Paenibacillus sp. GCM10023252]|uniref:nitroreductase family protein n=1 Tax=Paenibacillus sp. GCM10023252 TaxID=3252649 RepID=UPI003606613A